MHTSTNSVRVNILNDQVYRLTQVGQLIDSCFHDLLLRIGKEYSFRSVVEALYSELVSNEENTWIDENFRNTTALMIGLWHSHSVIQMELIWNAYYLISRQQVSTTTDQ